MISCVKLSLVNAPRQESRRWRHDRWEKAVRGGGERSSGGLMVSTVGGGDNRGCGVAGSIRGCNTDSAGARGPEVVVPGSDSSRTFALMKFLLSVLVGDFLLFRDCVALASSRNTEGVLARYLFYCSDELCHVYGIISMIFAASKFTRCINEHLHLLCRELTCKSCGASCNRSQLSNEKPALEYLVGNYIPISPVRDDVAAAYKKGMEWKASKMLLPYKQLCSEKKVEAEIVQIEADDVPVAISNEVSKSQISMLVIGASSGGSFTSLCCEFKVELLYREVILPMSVNKVLTIGDDFPKLRGIYDA
ncbi:hypothetical protein Syun_011488 [Stephania yunnanensis]|uniref:Uncharacterized protein n=1 Tax=Stephania yunnanensis TaxID=152371 RepID=A0AAP0PEE9_9MAGN